MRTLFTAILAMALALALAPAPTGAADDTATFFAVLNAGQEKFPHQPPEEEPPNSTATGNAILSFNEDSSRLCYSISFTPLASSERTSGVGSAHIHDSAAIGQNAPILFSITPGPSPIGTPKTGCFEDISSYAEKFLKESLLYINIHSNQFLGGEIRGQVLPVDKPTESSAH